MARPLSIAPGVLQPLRELPKREEVEGLLALCELGESFGQPHTHSGIGLRKLGAKLFECRGSLALRFIFQDRPTDLFVAFLGTHDDVKELLKSGKYR